MARRGPPKIVISTRREFVRQIEIGIKEFIGSPRYELKYNYFLRETESIENREHFEGVDPVFEIVISAVASAVVGAAVKFFLDWLREKRKQTRGFGHVVYKTMDVAISEAMNDLETVQRTKNYELVSAKSVGSFFEIILHGKTTCKKHKYVISRNCRLVSYNAR